MQSYYKHTGKRILEEVDLEQLPDVLFDAPFVLLAHNRFQEGVTDPLFTYANRGALELWETDWDTLVGMPSRKSAANEATTQQDRNGLLNQAADTGVINNYAGWRVAVTGTKFRIQGVTLFNVEEPDGTKIGQAALFDSYQREDGTVVSIPALRQQQEGAAAAAQAPAPPTAEELQAAEAGVKQWADYVRTLKEQHGLTNKDHQVQEAVASLQQWKAHRDSLQQRAQAAAGGSA